MKKRIIYVNGEMKGEKKELGKKENFF